MEVEQWINELVPGQEVDVTLAMASGRDNAMLRRALQDLSEGGFHVRKLPSGDRGPLYSIEGQNYRLHTEPREGKNSGRTMAAVVSVSKNNFNGQVPLVLRGSIKAEPLWEEPECQLLELSDLCRRLGQRRQEVHEELTRPAVFKTEWANLHRLVRKRYGTLRTVHNLLEQRVEVENAAVIEGTILSISPLQPSVDEAASPVANDEDTSPYSGPVSLKVEVDRGKIALEPPFKVEFSLMEGGPSFHAWVRDQDQKSKILFVELGRQGSVAEGQRVLLKLIPRFSLRQHRRALESFMDETVAGHWPDLAKLLIDPAGLPEPPPPASLEFFCEKEKVVLNDAQKTAVQGAVGTENAYLIQGPPGTGKTTVIAEIIRHLVHRGERVLLLAPTHVAVDEVLRRIGDKPGVHPLRLAWNEDLVNEQVRHYTPSRLQKTVLKRLSDRVDLTRRKQWQKQLNKLRSREADLSNWLQLEAAQRIAGEQHLKAGNAFSSYKESSDQRFSHATAAAVAARNSLAAAEQADVAAITAVTAAVQTKAQLRANARGLGQKVLKFINWGAFGDAHTAVKRATRQQYTTAYQREAARTAAGQAEQAQQQLADEKNRNLPTLQAALNTARSTAEAAASDWRTLLESTPAARAMQNPAARAMAETELSDARSKLDRLQHYEPLHDKWKQLVEASNVKVDDQLMKEMVQFTNLFCATTSGIGGDPLTREMQFDTLIVDEASRVTDGEFLIGAVRARRWILVGDEKQLPPFVEQSDEHWLHALTAIHKTEERPGISLEQTIPELAALWEEEKELHQFRKESVRETAEHLVSEGTWRRHFAVPYRTAYEQFRQFGKDGDQGLLRLLRDHLVRSLFERVVRDVPGLFRNRLTIQRRMVMPLDAMVRDPVYHGDYASPDGGIELQPLRQVFGKPLVFIDTSQHGKEASERQEGSGFVCPLEAAWATEVCRNFDRELREGNQPQITVSILCFYRAQAQEIRTLLGWPNFPGFQKLRFQVIDSIDRIQGQESDLVIISFGRARISQRELSPQFGLWSQDLRRLNVACTRARRALVMIGHRQTLERLKARPEAANFYRNLFSLVEDPAIDACLVDDFGGRKRHH